MRQPRDPRLRVIALPALAAMAIGGCGRAEQPPARAADTVATTVTSADTLVTLAATPVREAGAPWRAPRDPGDRCRRADGSDQRPGPYRERREPEYEDLGHGLAFVCTLRNGHPARFVLQAYDDGHPERVLVYAPPASTVITDSLLIEEAERPSAGSPILEGEDLDGDGWTDVRVRTFSGMGGWLADVFRYDPARRRFERDSVLSREGDLQRVGAGCVETSWKMSRFDGSLKKWCWREGRWLLVRAEHRTYDESLSTPDRVMFVTEIRELRGGQMRLVRADTTRDQNE